MVVLAWCQRALGGRDAAAQRPTGRRAVRGRASRAAFTLSTKHPELGVADDPTLTSPKNAAAVRVAPGPAAAPDVRDRGRRRRHPDQGPRHGRQRVHRRRARPAVYNIAPGQIAGGKVIPFVLAGVGTMNLASSGNGTDASTIKKDTDFEFHGGAGVKYLPHRRSSSCASTRARSAPRTPGQRFSPDCEVMGGVGFTFGGHAAAPPRPPPLVRDRTATASPTAQDKCPTEAGPRENKGCPDKDTRRRRHRRPQGQVPRQGRPGRARRLPRGGQGQGRHRRRQGQVPERGRGQGRASRTRTAAPDPDNDKDGVPDENDKCPNEPETKNGFQDDDGCPDEVPAPVKKFTRRRRRGSTSGATRPTSRRRRSRCSRRR